ncbi:MAG TPA: YkvA family protein [Xanthobacteraceae bacterium]
MGGEQAMEWGAEAAREQVRRGFWGKARRYAARLPFAEDAVAAYYCAFDRDTPRHVQAALVGALAYFILPIDMMPDVMPVLGLTDDAAALITAIKLVADNIRPEHRAAARRALARGLERG